ncbi:MULTISPECIES: LysR substrate-binding domain-containing protein [unclassified Mesorhizobium]|uniref:LysR substrate-binding domain-containing protein n=1 Tax=unclassified Mesorhizobium TaxID=325217 RepID=UPI001FE12505|nr:MULTISPECIES: LysR substrate-binding domain-containing protein [unclassified Mesorhizobium]
MDLIAMRPIHRPATRLPPLAMVRAFEAAARTGSMRKAGQDIGLSHTVISRHVKNLEAWLGTKLVLAGPRGISLTHDGQQFESAVSQAFNLICGAADNLRAATRKGTLRIWCMPGLATRWLTPRLSQIESLMPQVEIVLRASDKAPNLEQSEADVMIGFGDLDELPSDAVAIAHPRMFPVASPIWVADNPGVRSPGDLSRVPLIHEEDRQQWLAWFKAIGHDPGHLLAGPRLWNANLGLDAALAGQGVALATPLNAGADIAAGRLVELFATDVRLGGYYIRALPKRWRERNLSAFRTWIETNLKESLPEV